MESSDWLDSEGGSASGVPAVLKTKQDRLRLVSAENTMDSLPIITAHIIKVAAVARMYTVFLMKCCLTVCVADS